MRAKRGAVAVLVLLGVTGCASSGGERPAVEPPPAGASFDYQIGAPYPVDAEVISRDHAVAPLRGAYNVCYVNAFQAQPGATGDWAPDEVLRDPDGTVVMDEEWGEALLDLRTADKRARIAATVNRWVDDCAARGYRAVEPDNYDSYTRSHELLSAADAQAFIRLLAAHAHARGLAIGQKNTSELAGERRRNGLDFAIAEECGEQDNCGEFTAAFGDHVLVIEYTDAGLANACDRWGDSLSIVRRDRDVTAPGDPGYLRRTCGPRPSGA